MLDTVLYKVIKKGLSKEVLLNGAQKETPTSKSLRALTWNLVQMLILSHPNVL